MSRRYHFDMPVTFQEVMGKDKEFYREGREKGLKTERQFFTAKNAKEREE